VRPTPPHATRLHRRAFTLIELLVVVSIIVLLIALLMPALSRSRLAARGVACLSQTRQLQNAVTAYYTDHRAMMHLRHQRGLYWHFGLAPYLGDRDYDSDPNGKLDSSMAMLRCPSIAEPPVGSAGSVTRPWRWGPGGEGAYGANLWLFPHYAEYDNDTRFPREDFFGNYASVDRPNQVPVLIDSNWVGGWPDDVGLVPPDLHNGLFKHEIGYFMGRFCIDRHEGAVNASFADGSARRVALADLWQLHWHRHFVPTAVSVP
jgi:prepilin-type N-terminal cleavage/methylation domain-containing protein/prepilin-type processing-associated H-X9-DG protein